MTSNPNENEAVREATDYLHFTPDDPKDNDIYFDSFEEALDYINWWNWSFASEDWEPTGLFEQAITCKDEGGIVTGELISLTAKFWNL